MEIIHIFKFLKKNYISVVFIFIIIILLAALFLVNYKEKVDGNRYYDFELKNIPHCYSGNDVFCWTNDDQEFDDWEYRFKIKGENKRLIIRKMMEDI